MVGVQGIIVCVIVKVECTLIVMYNVLFSSPFYMHFDFHCHPLCFDCREFLACLPTASVKAELHVYILCKVIVDFLLHSQFLIIHL